MRRGRVALLAAFTLLALGGGAAVVVFASPTARARRHLEQTTPGEIAFDEAGRPVLRGHALAFAESPAMPALRDGVLLGIVQDEHERTNALPHSRLLLLATIPKRWTTRPALPYSSALDFPSSRPAEPTLEVHASGCLSQHAWVRVRTLERLPADPVLLEIVVELFVRASRADGAGREFGELEAAYTWLHDLSLTKPEVVRAAPVDTAFPGVWRWVSMHFTPFGERLDGGLGQNIELAPRALGDDLRAWLQLHRPMLPPQLKPSAP